MDCQLHASQLKSRLRQNNLKATSARLELLDVFEHAKKPLSVNEIAKKLPNSDKATVYRNVESLGNLGLIKQIRFQDRQAYYEIESSHHHHIICEVCGKISDIEHCKISVSEKNLLKNTGFTKINNHSLEFFGICNNCAK